MKEPAGKGGRTETSISCLSVANRLRPPQLEDDAAIEEAEALASSLPCPRPCRIPFHRLRVSLEDLERGVQVTDDNFGTDCLLCGAFVHMDEWHRIFCEDTGRPYKEGD